MDVLQTTSTDEEEINLSEDQESMIDYRVKEHSSSHHIPLGIEGDSDCESLTSEASGYYDSHDSIDEEKRCWRSL